MEMIILVTEKTKYNRKQRKEIIRALGIHCRLCGDKTRLEIHHHDNILRGRSRGTSQRISDWKRELSSPNCSLVLLCKRCHLIVDKDINSEKNISIKEMTAYNRIVFDFEEEKYLEVLIQKGIIRV